MKSFLYNSFVVLCIPNNSLGLIILRRQLGYYLRFCCYFQLLLRSQNIWYNFCSNNCKYITVIYKCEMCWAKVNVTEGEELWLAVLYEIPLLKP